MENPYILISNLLEGIKNQRTQEIIRRRFGLFDGRPQTLQEIGNAYDITRERVRQIEESGLEEISNPQALLKLKPLEKDLFEYINEYGQVRREEKLLDEMVCLCMPASQVEKLRKNEPTPEQCKHALNLILTLTQPFSKIEEDDYLHPSWTTEKNSLARAKKAIDSAATYFDKNRKTMTSEQLYDVIKKRLPGLSEKAVFSYMDAAKVIQENPFGEFGLIDWPEISPRGVRDKAYLIFKKEGKPLHFAQVTELINQLLPHNKPAYIQTVHNELIKDSRFVLIGRGIYALVEWGYQPGTVVDVIKEILAKEGPLTKEEITRKVLEKRLIKENTILINLQNKKYFKKNEDGRYTLAA
jgi:DNA-directed RNA polymerase delta subunit